MIAEIGINHEGDITTCARMIDAAARSGADAIKLQTIDADENYVEGTPSHALFAQAELSREDTGRMFAYARRLGMEAFTTAGDFATLEWVDRLAPAAHKISSGLLNNTPLIRLAARTGRTLLISTGMAETPDIDESVTAARAAGASYLGLFQCTSLYPAPVESLHLATIGWLASRYGVPTGFSDHSLGTEAAAPSVAAGARMIEKHLTLDAGRPGFDHAISLDEVDFTEMVRRVRTTEAMLGAAEKSRTPVEAERAKSLRRVVVARRDIAAGETLQWDALGLKRQVSGRGGLAPKEAESLLGRRTTCAIGRNEAVGFDHLEPRAQQATDAARR